MRSNNKGGESMKFYDFEYDGKTLTDLGYIICQFDAGSGTETISNGSNLTFNTVPADHHKKDYLVSSEYSESLTTTIQLCKNDYIYDDKEITDDEVRELTRWLNRRKFEPLRLINDKGEDFFTKASFNVSCIYIGDTIYGIELQVTTNLPFLLQSEREIKIDCSTSNSSFDIYDNSEEIGYINAKAVIKMKASGNLTITNSIENRQTYIANCTTGETITLDYPIISSSLNNHKIQNDFNWNFIRIANTYRENKNTLTVSLPCDIVITYSPIAKIGL